MITLNPFVENNKARINQFLNNLCEVGDFYDTLEVCVLFLTCAGNGSTNNVGLAGPIYGFVEEGPRDTHYSERTLQHTFINSSTYRSSSAHFVVCSIVYHH